MSSFSLSAVLKKRGLSARQFRVLFWMTEFDNGETISFDMAELAERVEMSPERCWKVLEDLKPMFGHSVRMWTRTRIMLGSESFETCVTYV